MRHQDVDTRILYPSWSLAVLGPILYQLYTDDIPTPRTALAAYADNTAILSVNQDATIASAQLKVALSSTIQFWVDR